MEVHFMSVYKSPQLLVISIPKRLALIFFKVPQIYLLILGAVMSEPKTPTPTPAGDTYKGWVFKWTNYIKGYQRRWFVLSNGLLSYYRYAFLQNTDYD